MKALWAVMCRSAITNSETNNFTLVEIVEGIAFNRPIRAMEPIPIDMRFVARIQKNKDEGISSLELRMRAPGGAVLKQGLKLELSDADKDKTGVRLNIAVPLMFLDKPGEYWFELLLPGDKVLASYSLNIEAPEILPALKPPLKKEPAERRTRTVKQK